MPDQNGQIEQKVNHILLDKWKLLWGAVVVTLAFAGSFYTIMLQQALTIQKLDGIISDFKDFKKDYLIDQTAQDNKISADHDKVVQFENELKKKQ